MNKIKIFQVDAFANKRFEGNPAAVCLLSYWISDEIMQNIAAENNLAETAFVVPGDNHFEIRWFTPALEVDLCGHATLAAAYIIFEHLKYKEDILKFHSLRSGALNVVKEDEIFYLDFPKDTLIPESNNKRIEGSIGVLPEYVFKGKTDYLAVLKTENELQNIIPNLELIAGLDARGLIVTAPGREVDFVSRFFAPQSGIDEDPVTGSAHTTLIPYWSNKLQKKELKARQISGRGGNLICKDKGERVIIGGKAKLYLSGEIYIN